MAKVKEIPFGTVPDGWNREHWAEHLEYMAARCEAMHPEKAREYREWARIVREKKE